MATTISWNRNRWRRHAMAAVVVSLMAAGCVSVDPRGWRETPDRAATAAIAGAWQARAVYRTTGELLGPASIADALQLPAARAADTVEIARTPDGGLAFAFSAHGDALPTRTVSVADGLRIDEAGSFTLPATTTCAGADLQTGCRRSSTTLFVNAHRELVFVTDSNALGMVTIIPMLVHAKHVSAFVRKTGDADVDNVSLVR
jgi:hypothetical protein